MTKTEKAKLDELLKEVKELREELRARTVPVPVPYYVPHPYQPVPYYPPWYVDQGRWTTAVDTSEHASVGNLPEGSFITWGLS